MANAELCYIENQGCLRFSDGREGLRGMGWYLTEISAFGLRRQAQRDTDFVDIRPGSRRFRLGFQQGPYAVDGPPGDL